MLSQESQRIQPLDCCFLGPLKLAYTQEYDVFIVRQANQSGTQRIVAYLRELIKV